MSLTKEDRDEIKKIVKEAIAASEKRMKSSTKNIVFETIDSTIEQLDQNKKTNFTKSDIAFRRKMLKHKAFSLTFFEKMGSKNVGRLAKQFQLNKQGGKWIPIEDI